MPLRIDTVGALRAPTSRWLQLSLGVVCMVMIANLQYGWTLFVKPLSAANGWTVAEIQVAFSLFVALETWLTPIEGWIVDWLGAANGPRLMIALGGLFVALGWVVNSIAGSLPMLYCGAILSGVGAGAVYATGVGNAVKWFPDRRGLAVGITAAGFGAGAALTVVPIREVIAAYGYSTAFFWFGLLQGAVVFVIAWWVRAPLAGETPAATRSKVVQTDVSYSPAEMLATPVFWVLYVMFVMVSASGLMATAQIALIAKDFNVADSVVLVGVSTLTLALLVDNVANGAARPLFGWISDQIGRENTIAIAFGLGGVSYWLLGAMGATPWAFVVFAGLIFLTWGEIFSLFPSTCTDSFGPKFATANLSFLYTAKGLSAFLVPVANMIKATTGSWHMVFADRKSVV
jgi:OFA family oxalate/formate antiporter-like MFS transporter